MIAPRRRFIIALTVAASTCGPGNLVKCKEFHDVDLMYSAAQTELQTAVDRYKSARRPAHLRVAQDDVDRAMRTARDRSTSVRCWVPRWWLTENNP